MVAVLCLSDITCRPAKWYASQMSRGTWRWGLRTTPAHIGAQLTWQTQEPAGPLALAVAATLQALGTNPEEASVAMTSSGKLLLWYLT